MRQNTARAALKTCMAHDLKSDSSNAGHRPFGKSSKRFACFYGLFPALHSFSELTLSFYGKLFKNVNPSRIKSRMFAVRVVVNHSTRYGQSDHHRPCFPISPLGYADLVEFETRLSLASEDDLFSYQEQLVEEEPWDLLCHVFWRGTAHLEGLSTVPQNEGIHLPPQERLA
jgi:hypothetical protein